MRIKVAVAVSVVLVLGAACDGGEPSPTTLPTAPPPTVTTGAPTTASPTPTPTPSAPTLPAAARADTPAGAQAFARFWFTTLDYAYKTGDTKPFRALGTCAACTALANGIDRHYAGGGRFEGGSFSALSGRTAQHAKGSAALVDLIYSRAAGQAIRGSGATTPVPAETGVEFAITLVRQPGSSEWKVTSVKAVKR